MTMTETRLWGETYPRDKIFQFLSTGKPPRVLWNEKSHFLDLAKHAGNVARFTLEDKPEDLNQTLINVMVSCLDWLWVRGYGFAQSTKFIHEERLRQQFKWGVNQDHPNDRFACILWEEVGEVCEDLENNSGGITDEIVQVASVACCWLEFRLTEDSLVGVS